MFRAPDLAKDEPVLQRGESATLKVELRRIDASYPIFQFSLSLNSVFARMADTPSDPISDGAKSIFSLSAAGLLFIYAAALLFALVGYLLARVVLDNRVISSVTECLPEIILSFLGVFSAAVGVGLVRAAGLGTSAPAAVINPAEWDVIKSQVEAGNEDSISQYIRLRSLTGFTGAFTKLGIQGLPLATIALTLFFSLMFLKDARYLDLAKLTLGAFIGSFVQKQVGATQGGGTVKLPGGETIKVAPSAPSTFA